MATAYVQFTRSMAPEIVVRTPVTTEIEALLHSWDLFSQVDVACLTLDRWRLVFG